MPRLTEQEQQEIIRYLEADKPLPDKYWFLLFEPNRGSNRGSKPGSSLLLAHRLLARLPQNKARLGRTSPGDDAGSKM